MKTKSRLACLLIALAGLLLAAMPAFAGPTVTDAKTELAALVTKIQTKLRSGSPTVEALAPELREFDTLLAAHAGEKTDDVAQILYMKATLYTEVLNDESTGVRLLRQLQADFPASAAAKRAGGLLVGMDGDLAIGKPFPGFAEQDLDGRPLSPAALKGKVVLIDFWAVWCGPCVAELPNVVKAYEKFHAAGFEIIGISLDREGDRQKLLDFTKANKMPWPQFYDGQYWQNKLAVKYGVNSIPATYLLDREGNIAAKNLRGPALEAKLAELLGKK
jgi:peroxiredoxin